MECKDCLLYTSFYTLPLKVSSNAIYLRIKENYEYKDVALLHSDAMAVYLREYNGCLLYTSRCV